jgi:uncharacterized membrane-anchored protein YhcB (DUF1043 family)
MSVFLQSFGIGIAFAVGVVVGGFLCSLATQRGRQELSKSVADHYNRVEDRLAIYVAHTERIAVAMEALAKKL